MLTRSHRRRSRKRHAHAWRTSYSPHGTSCLARHRNTPSIVPHSMRGWTTREHVALPAIAKQSTTSTSDRYARTLPQTRIPNGRMPRFATLSNESPQLISNPASRPASSIVEASSRRHSTTGVTKNAQSPPAIGCTQTRLRLRTHAQLDCSAGYRKITNGMHSAKTNGHNSGISTRRDCSPR